MAALKTDTLKLQDRDIAILRGLFECRIMTAKHTANLYFDGKSQAAKKRLQKLKAGGLIGERPRGAFVRSILFLTRAGLETLRAHGILSDYPSLPLSALDRRANVSDITIRHELEVVEVKAAFHRAIRGMLSFSVAEFSTWPLLHEFKASRSNDRSSLISVKPDGFVRIHETEATGAKYEHTFFLEVDRSNENQGTLIAKADCYRNYYRSGGFAARQGAKADDYQRFPFIVLMVFKSDERRNNTAERLLQSASPILRMAWLATIADVIKNPFAAIWVRPIDYREAVAGTPFDIKSTATSWGYRSQPKRETHVHTKVKKVSLLHSAQELTDGISPLVTRETS